MDMDASISMFEIFIVADRDLHLNESVSEDDLSRSVKEQSPAAAAALVLLLEKFVKTEILFIVRVSRGRSSLKLKAWNTCKKQRTEITLQMRTGYC